jgi:rRNA maturation endonuclease Nob1
MDYTETKWCPRCKQWFRVYKQQSVCPKCGRDTLEERR